MHKYSCNSLSPSCTPCRTPDSWWSCSISHWTTGSSSELSHSKTTQHCIIPFSLVSAFRFANQSAHANYNCCSPRSPAPQCQSNQQCDTTHNTPHLFANSQKKNIKITKFSRILSLFVLILLLLLNLLLHLQRNNLELPIIGIRIRLLFVLPTETVLQLHPNAIKPKAVALSAPKQTHHIGPYHLDYLLIGKKRFGGHWIILHHFILSVIDCQLLIRIIAKTIDNIAGCYDKSRISAAFHILNGIIGNLDHLLGIVPIREIV